MGGMDPPKRDPCPRCGLYFNPDCHGRTAYRGVRRKKRLKEARDWLATYDGPRVHSTIMAHHLNITKQAAGYALKELCKEGDLRVFKRGGRRIVYEVVA